jgi:hypothetical protein
MNDIKKILESEAGREMKNFLLKSYSKLNSLGMVKECDNAEEQAIELKATKKAVKILENILEQIIDFENSEENKKSDKDKLYNL